MADDLNEQIILGFFADSDEADTAADALKKWDKANEEIKLGAMGRLVLDENGKLDAKRYGAARTGRGALVGGAIGLLAAGLTGGLSLLAGVVGGGAIGGVTGKLTAGSFGLRDEAVDTIKAQLGQGAAALVVLCDSFEVEPTMAQLTSLGGKAESVGVSTKVLQAIHDAQVNQWRDDQYINNIESGGMV